MEACAGSGMLSCQLKAHGFDVLAVDFSGNKHRPFVGIVKLDLRLVSSWDFLRYVANSRRIALFHAGPPCGTSSRARGKPLANGEPGPQPLRSVDWPLGLPDLQGVDKLKVLSANAIYLQVAAFCKELQAQGVLWCVENPTRSIMWEIRDYVELQQFGWFVDFHACRHGSGRRKATSFLTNVQTFKALGLLCEGGHDHASWDPQLVDIVTHPLSMKARTIHATAHINWSKALRSTFSTLPHALLTIFSVKSSVCLIVQSQIFGLVSTCQKTYAPTHQMTQGEGTTPSSVAPPW